MIKILIGFPTYDGQKYCADRFYTHLKQLEIPENTEIEIFIVDTSKTDDYANELKQKGFDVVKLPHIPNTMQNISQGRKRVREEALKRDADYLFFVDTDIMLPPNALKKLLNHNKDIINGLYLGILEFDGKKRVVPIAYAIVDQESVRHLTKKEVEQPQLMEIGAAGLGCTLITKQVLKKVDFSITREDNCNEDAGFYKDCRAHGFKIYLDTSIRCIHQDYPENDPRNNLFLFEQPNTSASFSYNL